MNEQHGGPVILKPISEVANFQRDLIPLNISEDFILKPLFADIAAESDIRAGVIAFRDFLFGFCDYLISDGHKYAKPPNKPTSVSDYPFLANVTNVLVEIGYYSEFSKTGDSLMVSKLPSCTPVIDEKGKKKNPKINGVGLIECLRFLSLCGLIFTGVDSTKIDLNVKKLDISEHGSINVSYPDNSVMLTGLKVMSIAEMELRPTRRYWGDNNILRCDYRLLKTKSSDVFEFLKDYIHPLPTDVQKFILNLHQRYTDKGLTCVMTILGDIHFAYAKINESQKKKLSERDIYSKRIFGILMSLRFGYCLVVRSKKTDRYQDVIKTFPVSLQKKISRGYGCDRKMWGTPCQHSCQGIRIPLDDSIIGISKNIETWLDNEV